MLDKAWKEISDAKRPAKNLKYALLALGYAILGSLVSFYALDSFGLRSTWAIYTLVGGLLLLGILRTIFRFF